VTARNPGAPLTYHVARLLGEPTGTTREYDVSGVTVDPGDGLRLADPIEGRVRLTRTNRGLLVAADLRTAIEAECSRCLRDIEVPLDLRIHEEALPSIDLTSGVPLGASDEPDIVRLTDHHELELEPLVREAISLAEPIAPLCEEGCPGLCRVCGERMSDGSHDHPEDEMDPRLEALKAFRVDEEAQTE
jgi:uncharacterized protein